MYDKVKNSQIVYKEIQKGETCLLPIRILLSPFSLSLIQSLTSPSRVMPCCIYLYTYVHIWIHAYAYVLSFYSRHLQNIIGFLIKN